jgi:hypothetical protein
MVRDHRGQHSKSAHTAAGRGPSNPLILAEAILPDRPRPSPLKSLPPKQARTPGPIPHCVMEVTYGGTVNDADTGSPTVWNSAIACEHHVTPLGSDYLQPGDSRTGLYED